MTGEKKTDIMEWYQPEKEEKMEWLQSLGNAIDFIEENLLNENLCADLVAKKVAVSSFYFQKGFTILTGFGVGEYIRCRRLYVAAIEIAAGAKVIDTALKFCWETPESFTKAFFRFHGTTPQNVKGDTSKIKIFLPLKINVTVTGGNRMDYRVEKMDAMKIIGFRRKFELEDCKDKIPKFWGEICTNHLSSLWGKCEPRNRLERALKDNRIGTYGVCCEKVHDEKNFDYYIAGLYQGNDVPEELEVLELPPMTWVKFECTGPMPGALQAVNSEIFRTWLPTNGKYRIAGGFSIEWYSPEGKMSDQDYKSEIWIPVEEI